MSALPCNDFDTLFKDTWATVYTICRSVLKHEEDALDAAHDTFLRYLLGQDHWPDALRGQAPGKVLRRLAAMESDNYRKRRGRRLVHEGGSMDPELVGVQPSTVEALDLQRTTELVAELVETLPETYRVPVELIYLRGLPMREVAETLGVSESACRQRISRGIRRLRKPAAKAGLKDLLRALTVVAGGATLLVPPAGTTAQTIRAMLASGRTLAPLAVGTSWAPIAWCGAALATTAAVVMMIVLMSGGDAVAPTEIVAAENVALVVAEEPGASAEEEAPVVAELEAAPPPETPAPAVVVPEGPTSDSLQLVRDGEPVPGLLVHVYETNSQEREPECTGCVPSWRALKRTESVTDESGRLLLPESPVGAFLVVDAYSEAGWLRELLAADRTLRLDRQRMELNKNTTVRGTVVDSRGSAVAGATVSAAQVTVSGEQKALPIRATSGADGAFELTGLPGEFVLKGEPAENEILRPSPPMELKLASGELRSGVVVMLPGGVPFDGVVVDTEGEPIDGVFVSASCCQTTDLTDDGGQFQVLVPEGMIEIGGLSFEHPAYEQKSVENVLMEESPLTVTLRHRPVIVLVVKDADGKAVHNVQWQLLRRETGGELTGKGGEGWRLAKDVAGFVDVGVVEQGAWRALVREADATGRPTGRAGTADFVVAPGEWQDVPVVVGAGRVVTGVVVDSRSEQPVNEALVAIYIEDIEGGRLKPQETVTGEDGRFEFVGISEGNYRVDASRGDANALVNVDVHPESDPAALRLLLDYMATIRGEVTDDQGQPVEGAIIAFNPHGSWAAEQRATKVTTDAQGKYVVELLEPGAYWVACQAEGFSKTDYVTVQPGVEQEIDFRASDRIQLTGLIRINGKLWDGKPGFNFATTEHHSDRAWVDSQGGGRYRATIRRGGLDLWAHPQSGSLVVRTWKRDEIPCIDEEVCLFDIDVTMAEAQVLLRFPDDVRAKEGTVSLGREVTEVTGLLGAGHTRDVRTNSTNFDWLLPGSYKATYRSEDGEWFGTSERVELVAGTPATIEVNVRRNAKRIRAGSWRTDLVASEFGPLDLDVSGMLEGVSDFRVSLEYESGANALLIQSVALMRNGMEVSSDIHPGWSGHDLRNNVYSLQGSGDGSGRLVLRCMIRAAGDSNGGVWIMVPEQGE